MEVKSIYGRIIFSAIAIVMFLWIAFWTSKSVAADYLVREPELGQLKLAARLVPSNSDYQQFLGRYYLFTMEAMDLAKSETHFRKAMKLNPNEPKLWLQLASNLEYQGKFDVAEEVYLRAANLAPTNPIVAWSTGQFFLRQEKFDAALTHFRIVLLGTNNYNRALFETAWKALGDPNKILKDLIPPNQKTEIAYLNYLSEERRFDAAKEVWKRAIAHPDPFELRRAGPYIDQLLVAGMSARAHETWTELLANQPKPYYLSGGENLIVNGNFEEKPLAFGFDWREGRINGAVMEYDRSIFRSPGHSALIRFQGKNNVHYQHFFQWVKVKPLKKYRFKASMRTENITTDSGPFFEIIDPFNLSQLHQVSDDLVGTWGWQTVTIDFRTGPRTKIIQLKVARLPTRKLDNLVSGKVWIDDVSITPL